MGTVSSLYDVAQLANVSHVTVSNVLNRPGHRHLVAPQTAERVRTAAKKLGYQRNRVAASLARGRTQTIGVVVSSIAGGFYSRLLEGIERTCAQRDYHVLLVFAPDVGVGSRRAQMLIEECVAGLIVFGDRSADEIAGWADIALRANLPVVLVDQQLPSRKFDSVFADDNHGGLLATEHLLRLGHRRIGLVFGHFEQFTMQNRRRGYLTALQQAGLTPEESLMVGGTCELDGMRSEIVRLLESPSRPTAMFAASDSFVGLVLQFALELGMRIPGDLAVVGYGDTILSRSLSLTSIDQGPEDMGAAAVERLLARLANTELPVANLMLSTRLVVRHSCGAPACAVNPSPTEPASSFLSPKSG